MLLTRLQETIKPDHAVLVGLIGVALAHWGDNIFHSQAFVMAAVALIALSLMSGDWLVGILGAYIGIRFIALDTIGMGFAQDVAWIMAGMAVYVAVKTGEAERKTYLNVICGTAVFLATFALILYATGRPAVATLGNQNFLGAFLAISGLAFFRRRWWMFLPLILGCLWACHTATAIAAFCAGLGYLAFKWWGLVLSVAPGAYYFFAIDGNSLLSSDRIGFWADALQKIGGSWKTILFGVGPGIFWRTDRLALHSEYAYTLWYLGAIGLALVALYILRSFRKLDDRTIGAMFIAVLVDGIGNHLMHTAPTAMLAIIVFGLMDRP